MSFKKSMTKSQTPKRSLYHSLCLRSLTLLFLMIGLLGVAIAIWRPQCAHALRHTAIPSTWLGPPKNCVSAAEYTARYPERYQEVYAASSKIYQTLLYGGAAGPTEEVHFAPSAVLTIPQGRVIERDGWVVTPFDRFLIDVALHPPKSQEPLEKHPIFRRLHLPRIQKVSERVAVLAAEASACYYHWMFDILPKLELLRQSGLSYDKLYCSKTKTAFQKETLQKLGVKEAQLIQGDRGVQVQAQELLVPIHPTHTFVVQPWICEFLRREFLTPEVEALPAKRRIYVTRSLTKMRRILNEESFKALFEKHHIEVLALETLSVEEQVKLFNTCEWIIAPHGAGLTNLVFCRPGAQVVELMHPGCQIPCYYQLSQNVGVHYHRLVGEKAYRNGYQRLRQRLGLKETYYDYTLSVEKLTTLIEALAQQKK